MNVFRVSVLGSTRGSNLSGLHHGLAQTSARIVSVLSNKKESGILEKAKLLDLPYFYFPSDPPGNFEKELDVHLIQNNINLLVLMGYMKILSPTFVSRWKNKIINVHPSLLPRHAGLMNLSVHQAVLNAKEKQTGCTVHWVTEKVDAGGMVVQKIGDVLLSDTAEVLKDRVQKLEVDALIEAIGILCVKQ